MHLNTLVKRIVLLVLCFFLNTVCKGQENIKKNKDEKNIEEKLSENSKYLKELSYLKLKKDSLKSTASFSEANPIYHDILSLAEIHADTLNIIDALLELSYLNFDHHKFSEAKQYALRIDNTLKNENNKAPYYPLLFDSKVTLSAIYTNTSQTSKAFESALLANEYYEKIKDPKIKNQREIQENLLFNHLFLAGMFKEAGDEKATIASIESVLKLYKKDSGQEDFVVDSYLTLGSSYYDFKNDLDKAVSYTKKALDIAINTNDAFGQCKALNNLGKMYLDTDKELASNYFKKALIIAKNNDEKISMLVSYNLLSNLYLENNNFLLALKYADSALTLNKQTKYAEIQSNALVLKSKYYKAVKQPDIALKYLNENLNYAKSTNSLNLLEEAYEEMYRFYNEKGDFKNCKSYYDKYNTIKEKNEAKTKNSQLALLKVSYEYREASSKLEKERIAIQLSESKQKRIKANSYFIVTFIVLTTLFIIIVFIKQKRQVNAEKVALEAKQQLLEVKKEELDKEVKFKNKSVTNFALQINDKNELLKDIKSKLKAIKPANNGSKIMILDLMIQVSNDIEKNEEKVALHLEASQKNEQFEQKISELFLDLTEKEKTIVTKVRLGQGSKEIAQNLNITKASVDNYRYLIRKKMNVPKGLALESFIKNI